MTLPTLTELRARSKAERRYGRTQERARVLRIIERWRASAMSAATPMGSHAAECLGAAADEVWDGRIKG